MTPLHMCVTVASCVGPAGIEHGTRARTGTPAGEQILHSPQCLLRSLGEAAAQGRPF